MPTVIPILMIESTTKHSPLRLNRLLQLCSANLPVGGFSFSQGLEYAVEMGWVNNPESTKEWISFNLHQSIAYTDLALLNRLQKALVEDDFGRFIHGTNTP
jgi:urease accessory protein